MNRRDFLQRLSLCAAGIAIASQTSIEAFPSQKEALASIPVRRVTDGKGYYWFGYYDKYQFDTTNRYLLSMRSTFENRPILETDEVEIGMIDLKQKDKWISLGKSNAFSWQQGCMLQWIPGRRHEVIWNTRMGDRYVSILKHVKRGKERILSRPIYAVSPDGKWGISTNFERIQSLRPGYGYVGVPYTAEGARMPEDMGLYRVDLETGDSQLLFSIHDIAKIPNNGISLEDKYHWFNHLLVNTDGSRITFLHRWRDRIEDPQSMAVGGFSSRMFTCNPDGSDLFLLENSGGMSHFVWRDPTHLSIYAAPAGRDWDFYLYTDKTHTVEKMGGENMPKNDGHQSYFYNNRDWMVCDNYAWGEYRDQTPYLYQLSKDRFIALPSFYLPPEYTAEWRCDLHPRISGDGNLLCVDAVDEQGRQLYVLDLSGIPK